MSKWIAWMLVGGWLAIMLSWVAHADIREDFAAYESRGYVTGTRGPRHPAGNSLLYTAEKYFALHRAGALRKSDQAVFEDLVAICKTEPGVLRRTPAGYPFAWDVEGHDDYIGVMAASQLLGTSDALQILHHGEETKYVTGPIEWPFYYSIFDQEETTQDPRAWLGRFPATIAHFYYANNTNPPWINGLAWTFTIATAGLQDPTAQDPWLLSWLMIQSRSNPGWLDRIAISYWRKRLKAAYPGGIGDVFARYFNDAGHPLAVYLQGEGL